MPLQTTYTPLPYLPHSTNLQLSLSIWPTNIFYCLYARLYRLHITCYPIFHNWNTSDYLLEVSAHHLSAHGRNLKCTLTKQSREPMRMRMIATALHARLTRAATATLLLVHVVALDVARGLRRLLDVTRSHFGPMLRVRGTPVHTLRR